MKNYLKELMMYTIYFAPRGGDRLLFLGEQISTRHLSFSDRLIGIVGDAGSGKSSLIKGMFPGLELANDDDGIDPRKIMQVRNYADVMNDNATFHIDIRFQMAFTQMHEIVEFITAALYNDRRVIVEHFDLVYPLLKKNADILVGIGEEIIITRPNIFGPLPKDIYDIVYNSLKFRKMAHTAEDLTTLLLEREFMLEHTWLNADVRQGFVLDFQEEPKLDLALLERRINELIAQSLDVSYYDENHIKIGDFDILKCNGPRIHVRNTSDITTFKLIPEFVHDAENDSYSLVGLVSNTELDIKDLNKLQTF